MRFKQVASGQRASHHPPPRRRGICLDRTNSDWIEAVAHPSAESGGETEHGLAPSGGGDAGAIRVRSELPTGGLHPLSRLLHSSSARKSLNIMAEIGLGPCYAASQRRACETLSRCGRPIPILRGREQRAAIASTTRGRRRPHQSPLAKIRARDIPPVHILWESCSPGRELPRGSAPQAWDEKVRREGSARAR